MCGKGGGGEGVAVGGWGGEPGGEGGGGVSLADDIAEKRQQRHTLLGWGETVGVGTKTMLRIGFYFCVWK